MSPALEVHDVTLKDGTRVHYFTAGPATGETVVLLHGGGTDHALLSWADTLPALLAHGYRVYLPDAPGYGQSPLPSWPATLPHLNAFLAEWVDQVGLKRAAYCGISMGGALALGYALEHPERVSKLVLIGSYGLQKRAPLHTLSYFMVRMPGFDRLNGWLLRSPRLLRQSLAPLIRNPASLTDELVQEVAQAMTNPASQIAWNQFQRHEIQWRGVSTNFRSRLQELRVPTLLLHGSHDSGVPVSAAREAARLIPEATLHVVEGAGHWTQRDRPDEVNYALLRFLGQT